jgi:thiol-disulfide isomerase/thioredoxin
LRTLSGQPTRLTAYLAKSGTTLVVFWNPECGFCEQMLSELREIDAAHSGRLVVISTGSLEDNRAIGLRAPVLLEDGFVTGDRLGVAGTPSALLVDPRGRLVSEVAVGSDAVIALASPDGAPVAA